MQDPPHPSHSQFCIEVMWKSVLPTKERFCEPGRPGLSPVYVFTYHNVPAPLAVFNQSGDSKPSGPPIRRQHTTRSSNQKQHVSTYQNALAHLIGINQSGDSTPYCDSDWPKYTNQKQAQHVICRYKYWPICLKASVSPILLNR